MAAIQLVVEVDHSRCARAGARQGVGLGDRESLARRSAVRERSHAIAGGLVAILRCGLAVAGDRGAVLGGLAALLRGARVLIVAPCEDVGAALRARVALVLAGSVAPRRLAIASVGGVVAGEGRNVAVLRAPVALARVLQAPDGALLTLARTALTDLARQRVRTRVGAVGEIATAGGLIEIAGGLVEIRRELIAVGARLIAVGDTLVGICQRLVAVGQRLLTVCERLHASNVRGDALLLCLDRAGAAIHTLA